MPPSLSWDTHHRPGMGTTSVNMLDVIKHRRQYESQHATQVKYKSRHYTFFSFRWIQDRYMQVAALLLTSFEKVITCRLNLIK